MDGRTDRAACTTTRKYLCIPAAFVEGRQHLRSAATGALLVPHAQTATGQRSFAVNRPTVWNSLPPALSSPDLSQNTFKRALKMHLFSSVQRHWVIFETLPLLINLPTYLLNPVDTGTDIKKYTYEYLCSYGSLYRSQLSLCFSLAWISQ